MGARRLATLLKWRAREPCSRVTVLGRMDTKNVVQINCSRAMSRRDVGNALNRRLPCQIGGFLWPKTVLWATEWLMILLITFSSLSSYFPYLLIPFTRWGISGIRGCQVALVIYHILCVFIPTEHVYMYHLFQRIILSGHVRSIELSYIEVHACPITFQIGKPSHGDFK